MTLVVIVWLVCFAFNVFCAWYSVWAYSLFELIARDLIIAPARSIWNIVSLLDGVQIK